MTTPADIGYYLTMGFKKVCSVKATALNEWEYYNIDESVMYDTHRSWVYLLVLRGKIFKIGETGNPLGIRAWDGDQPSPGSTNRLGRYRKGDKTDANIRTKLIDSVDRKKESDTVEFYAVKCQTVENVIYIGNKKLVVQSHYHKDLEKQLLDHYEEYTGSFPPGNKGRC